MNTWFASSRHAALRENKLNGCVEQCLIPIPSFSFFFFHFCQIPIRRRAACWLNYLKGEKFIPITSQTSNTKRPQVKSKKLDITERYILIWWEGGDSGQRDEKNTTIDASRRHHKQKNNTEWTCLPLKLDTNERKTKGRA